MGKYWSANWHARSKDRPSFCNIARTCRFICHLSEVIKPTKSRRCQVNWQPCNRYTLWGIQWSFCSIFAVGIGRETKTRKARSFSRHRLELLTFCQPNLKSSPQCEEGFLGFAGAIKIIDEMYWNVSRFPVDSNGLGRLGDGKKKIIWFFRNSKFQALIQEGRHKSFQRISHKDHEFPSWIPPVVMGCKPSRNTAVKAGSSIQKVRVGNIQMAHTIQEKVPLWEACFRNGTKGHPLPGYNLDPVQENAPSSLKEIAARPYRWESHPRRSGLPLKGLQVPGWQRPHRGYG